MTKCKSNSGIKPHECPADTHPKAEKLISLLGVEKVRHILQQLPSDDARYYVHEKNKWDDMGYFSSQFVVGIHNPHTHYSVDELRQAVELQPKATHVNESKIYAFGVSYADGDFRGRMTGRIEAHDEQHALSLVYRAAPAAPTGGKVELLKNQAAARKKPFIAMGKQS